MLKNGKMNRPFVTFLALLSLLALTAGLAGCSGGAPASPASAAPAQAASGQSDWSYISGKGNMIIGITYFQPMDYLDASGNLVGFEADFARAVCEKIGVTPTFQVIDWDAKETELNAKNIDCIWNGMCVTDERKQNMDLTQPYMANRQVMVVRATDADKYSVDANIDGASVVAEKGSTGEPVAQDNPLFAKAKYTALDSQAKTLLEVKSGTADIAVIDYTMALASTGPGTDYTDLKIINGERFDPQSYAVAFRKNSPETLAKVNQAMSGLAADGTLKTIADTYHLGDLLLLK